MRNSVSLDLETSPGGEVHAVRHWAWEWEYIRPVLLMVASLPSMRRVLSSVAGTRQNDWVALRFTIDVAK